MKTFLSPNSRIKSAVVASLVAVAMSACADSTGERVDSAQNKLESDETFEICEMVYVEDDLPVADGGVTEREPTADGGLVVAAPPPQAPNGFAPAGGVRVQGRWTKICRTIGRCVAGNNPIKLVTAASDEVTRITTSLQALTAQINQVLKTIADRKAQGLDVRLYQEQLGTLQRQHLDLQALLIRAREHLASLERAYADYLVSCDYWAITP